MNEINHRACSEAANEIDLLRGERKVFADLLDEVWLVLHTIDGDDDEEERQLRDLRDRVERLALHARGVELMGAQPIGEDV